MSMNKVEMDWFVDKVIERGWVPSENGERLPIFGSVDPAEAHVLGNLILESNAKTAIETGIARGISSLAIAQALKETGGKLIGFDPCQDSEHQNAALALLREYSLENILDLRREPAQSGITKINSEQKIDFAFVDDIHNFHYRFTTFFHLDKILGVGGILAFHDLWLPSMKKLLRLIRTLENYELITTPTTKPNTGLKLRRLAGAVLKAKPYCLWWPNGFSNLLVLKKVRDSEEDFTWFKNF